MPTLVAWFHAVRTAFNGRLRQQGIIEHWCKGCCDTPDDFYTTLDWIIDNMFFPTTWKSSTWNDMQQTYEFHGLWLSIHGIFTYVYEDFVGVESVRQSMEPVPALMDVEEDIVVVRDDASEVEEAHTLL